MMNLIKAAGVTATILMLSGGVIAPPRHRVGYYDAYYRGDYYRGYPHRVW